VWIVAPRIIAAAGVLWTLGWWSHVGGGVLVLALMLAPSVIMPLGLALALGRDGAANPPLVYRAAVSLLAIDVLASGYGWSWAPGHATAIACACIHLVVCVLVALFGVTRAIGRLRAGGVRAVFVPLHELAIDVGLALVPIGAVWLLASRASSPLAGFHEPIVTLTGAHFHYAGFAAPLVIGCTGRVFELEKSTTARAYSLGTIVVCGGIPLTAIGIMTTHTVEAIAAVTLASGMLVACVLLVVVVARRAAATSKPAAALFAVSGVALSGTMALAATFALTSSAGRSSTFSGPLSVQTMIDFHGGGNALGFALGALVALTLVDLRRTG
jgi:hypothetical protein